MEPDNMSADAEVKLTDAQIERQEYLEFRQKKHNERMNKRFDEYTLTGVRLVRKDDAAEGMVVNFYPGEEVAILEAIRGVLARRVE